MQNKSLRYVPVLLAALLISPAMAKESSNRAGKFEMSLPLTSTASEEIQGERGSRANIESDPGIGFSFAFNLDEHWALGMDFLWHSSDYRTTTTPDIGNASSAFDRTGTIDINTTSFTAAYYFSPSRFTPYVSGNLGRTWIDTNIPDGAPVNSCWWDPYWGQYCGTSVPTKSDVFWSYGLGLGIRWDSSGPLFLRASVNEQWLDVGGAAGTPSFTIYRVDIGAYF